MLIYRHVVREVASLIAGAVGRSIESLQEGSIEQEPQMTDRMLGRIEECLHGYVAKGVRWTAKTLTDRGRGAHTRLHPRWRGCDSLLLAAWKAPAGVVGNGLGIVAWVSGERPGRCRMESEMKRLPQPQRLRAGPP